MKLIAKAKPVRIRIKSGNEEHISLDSLRKNFVWADVSQLFDGRLSKWLKRINKDAIAERLSELENPDLNKIDVYNILFQTDFHDLKDVLYAAGSDRSLETFAEELCCGMSAIELISLNITNKLISNRVLELSDESIGQASGDELFTIGKFLYKCGTHTSEGKKYIIMASEKSVAAATTFINDHFPEEVSQIGVSDWVNQINVNNLRLQDNWYNRTYLQDADGVKGKIIALYNTCLNIFNKYFNESKNNDTNALSKLTRRIKREIIISDNDPLMYEKLFMLALFESHPSVAKIKLRPIESEYKPAKELIDTGKFTHSNVTYRLGYPYPNIVYIGDYLNEIQELRKL
ncbi:MAG: hypothetical protein K2G07_04390 [Muribaculaceae bacterium]|nr:hypothetical protein [Muribaculaceae bacterium]